MKKMKTLFLSLALLSTATMSAGNLEKSVDKKNLDTSVAPGADFYQYACGGWMKANPLDPQYARFGTFDQLAENSKTQVKELIEGLAKGSHARGSNSQKIADLFNMGMDSERLNREGGAPLKNFIEQVSKSTRADFTKLVATFHNGIASPFFNCGVIADLKNSDVNLVYLGQDGMGLGDRDYYIENDANTKRVRDAYVSYIQELLQLVGYKKGAAKKAATNVMKIETALAQVAMSREEQRDYNAQYNIYSIEQLKNEFPHIAWSEYFSVLKTNGINKVCVSQPKSIAKVDEMLANMKEEQIREYLIFKYIDAAAPYLSDNFVQAHFDMYSKALSGKKVMQPRWKRALQVPNTLLGEAVGQLYVAKYFPANSKKKMQDLVDNLRRALGEHISGLPWMSPQTKVNALVKLNSFTVKIGYPEKWRDYSAVAVDPALSYWQNVLALNVFEATEHFAKYNKPVDKDRWQMTPQTVNAYYEPSTNEICFPAAILQKPYFDPEADDASNYGSIGVVIGHEMTHGFDDQGRNFNADGNMIDWWTKEDAQKFQVLADKLGAQYSAEIVADDVHANGNFTMGENIADQGGLRVSYTAFKKTPQGQSNEKLDGFTPDQRFFLSYANVWANNITKEEILRRTKVDPHSIGKNRVNVALRNLLPFFKAFNIKEGDAMYRTDAERVTIW